MTWHSIKVASRLKIENMTSSLSEYIFIFRMSFMFYFIKALIYQYYLDLFFKKKLSLFNNMSTKNNHDKLLLSDDQSKT